MPPTTLETAKALLSSLDTLVRYTSLLARSCNSAFCSLQPQYDVNKRSSSLQVSICWCRLSNNALCTTRNRHLGQQNISVANPSEKNATDWSALTHAFGTTEQMVFISVVSQLLPICFGLEVQLSLRLQVHHKHHQYLDLHASPYSPTKISTNHRQLGL